MIMWRHTSFMDIHSLLLTLHLFELSLISLENDPVGRFNKRVFKQVWALIIIFVRAEDHDDDNDGVSDDNDEDDDGDGVPDDEDEDRDTDGDGTPDIGKGSMPHPKSSIWILTHFIKESTCSERIVNLNW